MNGSVRQVVRPQRPMSCMADDAPVMEALRESVVTTVQDGYGPNAPSYLVGYTSQNAYFKGVDLASRALERFGFEHEFVNQQHRLYCPDRYFVPVRVRFARGEYRRSRFRLNARKGPETLVGIWENHYFRLQSKLPAFDTPPQSGFKRILNLFVVLEFNEVYLQAYLVQSSELKGVRLMCDDYVRFANHSLSNVTLPGLGDSNDSPGYDIDFGERNTGTE